MTPSDGPHSRSPQGAAASGAEARREAFLVGLLVALGYALLRSSLQWAPGAFADDGVYLAVGKALAEGEGYRSLHAAGAPIHAKYPPGLPWIYSLFWKAGGSLARVHAWSVAFSLAMAAAAAGVFWWVGRRTLGVSRMWLMVGVVGPFFLEGTIQYLNLPLSEPLFLLLVAVACAAFPAASEGRASAALVVAASVSAAVLVRTQGLVLPVALGLAYPWSRARWKPGLTMLGLPVAVATSWSGLRARWLRGVGGEARGLDGPAAGMDGPDVVWGAAIPLEPDELGYGAILTDAGPAEVMAHVGRTIRVTSSTYLELLTTHLGSMAWLGVSILVVAISASWWGAIRARRRAPFAVWSTLGLTGVLFVWPYAQDRFLLTLLPMWGLLAAAGTPPPGRLWRSGAGRGLALGMVVVLSLIGARQVQVRHAVRQPVSDGTPFSHPAWFLGENTRYLTTTAGWLNEHGLRTDRVLAPLPAGIYLLTGLQATNATPFEPIGRPLFGVEGRYLAERIRDQRVSLLVLWGSNYPINRDAAMLQQACPQALDFTGTTPAPIRAAVFRIRSEDECLAAWVSRVTT